MIGLALRSSGKDKVFLAEENIKTIVVVAVFVLLGGVYLFNATNPTSSSDIPTDLLVAAASLIVGYYFRGRR